MLKLRAEIDGKIYDSETAELVESGWKIVRSGRVIAARFVADEGKDSLNYNRN